MSDAVKSWLDEILWSDSDAALDAFSVCYAFDLMRYTDAELAHVVQAIKSPEYEGCIAAEREIARRLAL